MRRPSASRILSVRVERAHRRILHQVMEREGLPSESAAARALIEREGRRRAALAEVVQEIRALDKAYKGRKVRASEGHDAFLGRLRD